MSQNKRLEINKFEAKISWRDIDTLVPYEHNAKAHSSSQIDLIATSIAEFGFTVPILVDRNGAVVSGHGRLQAAKRLSLDRVPVIDRSDLTPAQVKQLRIMDNKSAQSDWDMEMLALDLTSLEQDGDDPLLTGFSVEEIEDILQVSSPGALDDIDGAGDDLDEDGDPGESDGLETFKLRLPPETADVLRDMLKRARLRRDEPDGVVVERLVAAVDIDALAELIRQEGGART